MAMIVLLEISMLKTPIKQSCVEIYSRVCILTDSCASQHVFSPCILILRIPILTELFSHFIAHVNEGYSLYIVYKLRMTMYKLFYSKLVSYLYSRNLGSNDSNPSAIFHKCRACAVRDRYAGVVFFSFRVFP